jgi:NadR type nicotinamide-nucleotide adenylyltransferase
METMEKNSAIKIAVVGAESTGKSWLCAALAAHYKSVWVKEYAREYFNNSDIYNYTQKDLEVIAEEQLRLENEGMLNAGRFLFCDTAMITLQIWAELEFQGMAPQLQKFVEQGQYDFYLLCDNSISWEQDAQRLNRFSRDLIFALNQSGIEKLGVPFAVVKGSGEDRLANAVREVETHLLKV